MDEITQLVAQNLKRIREEKKLSLDKLADLTGVSKSMLGQIERGDFESDNLGCLEDCQWIKNVVYRSPKR